MLTSKRLLELTKYIESNDFVADIGADHGKFIIEIANKYKNQCYLAVENKEGPFSNLKKSVEKYNFNKNIECSLSDGIDYLPNYVNTLVFSGMGGYNVIEILSKNIEKLKYIKKIVFSVHKNSIQLEQFLKFKGFIPCGYSFVKEGGILYTFICVKYDNTLSFDNFNKLNERICPKTDAIIIQKTNKDVANTKLKFLKKYLRSCTVEGCLNEN